MQQEAKSSKPPTTSPIGFMLDEELVIHYLYNKVTGQPLPCGLAVKECNIYGDTEPWELWDIYGGPNFEKEEDLYVFTELKRKGVNDSRFVRKVGLNGGAWKAENSAKIIQDRRTKRSIGIKKRFRYENSKSRHNGCWFMFEYSLHRSLLGPNTQVDDYVICRIQRKGGKRESEKGVVIANLGSPEIVLIEDEQSPPRTQGSPQEAVFGEAKDASKIVPNREDVGRKINKVKLDTRREVLGSQPPLVAGLLANSASQGLPVINVECAHHVGDELVVADVSDNILPASAVNTDPALQYYRDLDQVSYTDWAICFAEDLLQDQPVELLEENEIEMVPNMFYIEKWLDWKLLP